MWTPAVRVAKVQPPLLAHRLLLLDLCKAGFATSSQDEEDAHGAPARRAGVAGARASLRRARGYAPVGSRAAVWPQQRSRDACHPQPGASAARPPLAIISAAWAAGSQPVAAHTSAPHEATSAPAASASASAAAASAVSHVYEGASCRLTTAHACIIKSRSEVIASTDMMVAAAGAALSAAARSATDRSIVTPCSWRSPSGGKGCRLHVQLSTFWRAAHGGGQPHRTGD